MLKMKDKQNAKKILKLILKTQYNYNRCYKKPSNNIVRYLIMSSIIKCQVVILKKSKKYVTE